MSKRKREDWQSVESGDSESSDLDEAKDGKNIAEGYLERIENSESAANILKIVEELIADQRVDGAKFQDENGWSALHMLAGKMADNRNPMLKAASLLLDNDCPIDAIAKDFEGGGQNTALSLAAKLGNISMVKFLLGKGAKVNLNLLRDDGDAESLLQKILNAYENLGERDVAKVIKLLIESGADQKVLTDEQKKLLELALEECENESARDEDEEEDAEVERMPEPNTSAVEEVAARQLSPDATKGQGSGGASRS